MFARLIDDFVAVRGVHPAKVYLLGYSAGGDGVWQLAPRMPDRFAAAAMMAGHTNGVSTLGVRNLPFAMFVGGADTAYNRHKVVAEKIAGVKGVHPLNTANVAGCTYCWPQVASVGLTEAKARDAGYEIKVGRFPFMGNGKAIALGEPEGFVKTVFDAKTGELLGAHMVGAEVTELIQGYTIGKTAELVEADFMNTVFAHPTLSEMMHESVLSAYGRALHF
jgi:pimeloyl-ACP methyl ester carboxylesterase